MIVIIDYGVGNIRSVYKALMRLNVNAIVSNQPNIIKNAKKLILPGVGHFRSGMKKLRDLGLIDLLSEVVLDHKKPILGICLGMQLFSQYSEEGDVEGFKWIDAKTLKFNFCNNEINLKVPHIGWNSLISTFKDSILENIHKNDLFYFVHSYYVMCSDMRNVLCRTKYGIEFHSVIRNENIIGLQFHPEKSHSSGLKILKNFIKII